MTAEIDEMPKSGRESAICELRCPECSCGVRFDQPACSVCGWRNPRFPVQDKQVRAAQKRLREFSEQENGK